MEPLQEKPAKKMVEREEKIIMRRDLLGAVGLTMMLLLSLAWCGQNPADSGPAPEMSAWQWDHVRLMAPTIRAQGL